MRTGLYRLEDYFDAVAGSHRLRYVRLVGRFASAVCAVSGDVLAAGQPRQPLFPLSE